MNLPQDEATLLFHDVLRALSSSNQDLKLALRQCYLACQLLDWHPQRQWFERELNGYLPDAPVPPNRHITGKIIWRAQGSLELRLHVAVQNVHSLVPESEERADLEFRGGIDLLTAASKVGYEELAGETRVEYRRGLGEIPLEKVRHFEAQSFVRILQQVEASVFSFASQSYTYLRYGSALSDIWSRYRQRVDSTLHNLNLTNHLDAIQSGLRSANPQDWRVAAFACRNMLNDVANYLWQDPRKTYGYIKNPEGKSLDVIVYRVLQGIGQPSRCRNGVSLSYDR